MKKIYWALGTLIVVVIAVLLFKPETVVVQVAEVRKGQIIQTVEDTALVRAIDTHNLYAPATSGTVVKIPVKIGQAVKRGEVILKMESTALNKQIDDTRSRLKQIDASIEGTRAALNRAQLQLADAQDKFVRIQQLFQAGAVSQVEYEKARLLVETCRQNLNEQKSMLDRIEAQKAGLNQLLKQLTAEKHQLVVRSPVDGVVLDLPVKNGQIPPPGTLLASIAVPNQLEIKADILIDDLAGIQTGQKATITAPVLGDKILTGEVKEIYPQAYEKTSALGVIQRRVPVIISLTDTANLKPGYEVRVSIETFRKQNILVVPRQAVRTIAGGQQKVMVVVDNRVQHRFIETGITDGENVEVTSGLSAEELVILDGSMELAEGTKVNWE